MKLTQAKLQAHAVQLVSQRLQATGKLGRVSHNAASGISAKNGKKEKEKERGESLEA